MGGLGVNDPKKHMKGLVRQGKHRDQVHADAQVKQAARAKELEHPRFKHGEFESHTAIVHGLTGDRTKDLASVDRQFKWHGSDPPGKGRYSHQPDISAKVGTDPGHMKGYGRPHKDKGGPGSYYVRFRPRDSVSDVGNKNIEHLGATSPAEHEIKTRKKKGISDKGHLPD